MILLAALFKCVDPITSVAANLSFKDPFYRPMGKLTGSTYILRSTLNFFLFITIGVNIILADAGLYLILSLRVKHLGSNDPIYLKMY